MDGRLESIRLSKGLNSLHNREYVYDRANQITDILNHTNSSLSQHYDYDVLSRLTGATGEYGELTYDYDEVGNRLSRQWLLANGQTQVDERYQYALTSNQLGTVQNADVTRQFSYNDNGHTAFDSKKGKTLTYNAANRLSHIAFADGSEANYIYNAKGQRVVKTLTETSGQVTTTHHHFNQQNLLIAETDDSGKPLIEYIYLNKQRVASVRYQDTEQSLDYVHNDHIGSPMLQSNGKADITWRNQTLPFGQEYAVSKVTQGFGFPGQYQDQESGYSYNYFRDYDPSLGRYIQSDPIGLAGGVNTYIYAGSNPISRVDVWGLNWSNSDSMEHYRNGNGRAVTLRQIGHLSTIRNSSVYSAVNNRFSQQIYNKVYNMAKANGAGSYQLTVDFKRSYDFTSDKFFIGSATLSGEFNGVLNVSQDGQFAYLGSTEFEFYDNFTDPYDLMNNDIFGAAPADWNPNGTPFEITDKWNSPDMGAGICK